MQLLDCIKVYDNVLPIEPIGSFVKWLGTQKFQPAPTIGGLNREIRKADHYKLDIKSPLQSNVHWHNFLYKALRKHLQKYAENFIEFQFNDIINNMDDTISIYDNGAFITNPAHVQCEAINEAAPPPTVNWPFTVVNEQPLYNAGAATLVNFRLHKSEEQELVIKILELAGITINKPGLYQLAAGEEQQHTTTSPKQ